MYNGQHTWLVIQTFNRRELSVSTFLTEKGLNHFIPMRFQERYDGYDKKPKRVLVPVVHNYVFVEKTLGDDAMQGLLVECPYPSRLLKLKNSDKPSEISNREMSEFRMLCDPKYEGKTVIEENAEDLEIGREVEVIHGTFAGIRGRLIRKKNQYWFIKTLAGISVKLRITRWFCRPINE